MEQTEFVSLSPGFQIPLILAALEQGHSDLLSFFCEQYSDKKEVLVQWFSENPSAGEKFIRASISSPEVPLVVAFAKICARIDGLEQALAEAGCITKILTGLQATPNHDLIKSIFQTIGLLASDYKVRETQIHQEKVVEISIKMLNQHKDDPVVCLAVLKALVNCFYQSPKNKLAFSIQGGIEEIFPLLNNPTSEAMALVLTQTFHNLTNTRIELRLQMVPFGIVTGLNSILSAHMNNPSIVENILWSYLNLTLNSRDIKGELNQRGAIPTLFQVLDKHMTNQNTTYLVVALLNQISSRTTTRVVVAAQSAIRRILELHWAWPQVPRIQLLCLKTLDILCTLSSCRKRLVEDERLNKLITWLTENIDNRPCIQVGLDICSKLSISSGDSRRALHACGGPTFFLGVTTKYPHDQNLTDQCETCSQSITEPPDYENESSDEEVLSSDADDGSGSGEYD